MMQLVYRRSLPYIVFPIKLLLLHQLILMTVHELPTSSMAIHNNNKLNNNKVSFTLYCMPNCASSMLPSTRFSYPTRRIKPYWARSIQCLTTSNKILFIIVAAARPNKMLSLLTSFNQWQWISNSNSFVNDKRDKSCCLMEYCKN